MRLLADCAPGVRRSGLVGLVGAGLCAAVLGACGVEPELARSRSGGPSCLESPGADEDPCTTRRRALACDNDSQRLFCGDKGVRAAFLALPSTTAEGKTWITVRLTVTRPLAPKERYVNLSLAPKGCAVGSAPDCAPDPQSYPRIYRQSLETDYASQKPVDYARCSSATPCVAFFRWWEILPKYQRYAATAVLERVEDGELTHATHLRPSYTFETIDPVLCGDSAPPSQYFWPVPAGMDVSRGYKAHVDYQTCGWHTGIDIPAAEGATIFSVASGRVVHVGHLWAKESGKGRGPYAVVVQHAPGLYSTYSHNARALVNPGDCVWGGQQIAEVGSLGKSTGPHLHLEILTDTRFTGNWKLPFEGACARYANPLDYLTAP
ncbi:MAG: M23 family metallopeptidase [Deltaproteobacteria bacterium]|nr:M23 family metallopeptidase [Deltaproteobacteria bacterium]